MVDVSVPDNRLFFSCAGSGLTLALVRVRYDTMPEQEKSPIANLSPVFEYIKIVRSTSGRSLVHVSGSGGRHGRETFFICLNIALL